MQFISKRKKKQLHQNVSNVHALLDACVCNQSSALDKDRRISVVGMPPPPTSMRCDPIRWKQSLFTASDRANLFLHQHWEVGGGEKVGGGTTPTLISGLSSRLAFNTF